MTTYNAFIGQNASRYWDESTKNYPQILQHLKAFGDFRSNGEKLLDDFQPFDIVYFSDDLLAKGKGPATVNRYLSSVSKIFTKAYKMRLIRFPMEFEKHREPESRQKVYSDREVMAIISYLEEKRPWMRDYCLLSLHTGMRRGEIASITGRCPSGSLAVGYYGNCWDAGSDAVTLAKTKNGDARTVPLNIIAREALGRLFSGDRGYYNGFQDSTWKRTWKALRKEMVRTGAFEADDEFVFHSFRHTCASNLVNNLRVPTALVAKILGHRKLETTLKYVHADTSTSLDIMEQMASLEVAA